MNRFYLFGCNKPWNPPSWTTTDDRVRGGASQSYLTALPNNAARFHGNLDIKTLGGAGFASQSSPLAMAWDLSAYDGLEIVYGAGDGKSYTVIIKDDEPAQRRDDGREKASINWEADFVAEGNSAGEVWLPWADFKATFRGKDRPEAGDLKTGSIKRVGLMMRSQFGKQEGEFSIEMGSICAKKAPVAYSRHEL